MQMNEMGRGIRTAVKVGICVINALMLLGIYIANANYSTLGFTKTGFGILTEIGFGLGLVAVATFLIIGRFLQPFYTQWMLFVLVTLWNQVCILMFLISLIPFHLR